MKREVVKKGHNFIKIICFILGYVFLIVTALLSGYGIDGDTPLLREAGQGMVVELAAIVILAAFYIFVCRKLFPAAKEYELRFSNIKIITGLFLICPFVVFIYANMVSLNFDHIFGTVEAGSWPEVLEELMFFPLAAIIGPVFEEMCCRVMGISLFSTKTGKIAALFIASMLFAFCHGSNFWVHLPGAFIYGTIMICSRNIILPMIVHMAWNTATFAVPVISDMVVLWNPKMNYGIWGSPAAAVVLFVCAFVLGIYMMVVEVRNC